jgi:peptidoglycan/xylan/chitin deacetylase (PgdA/CDA1 family)
MGGGWGKVAAIAGAIALGGTAMAEPCPGHPDALGTSRTLILNPAEMPRIGTHDYGRTLPLEPREVVLTFDDGPMSPYTPRVLETLAKHCVKAVFFLIGRNARSEPATVRQILAAGHTIGTHTENHPLQPMGPARAEREIATGIATVSAALGDARAVAPFFRFPGPHHTTHGEHYLRARAIAAWSIDIDSDDWKRSSAEHVLHNVLRRLEAKGRGIILMHDVQLKTVMILPTLLAELKARGYRVVHVVPSDRPTLAPDVIATPQPSPPNETTGMRMPNVAAEPRPWPIAVVPQATPSVTPKRELMAILPFEQRKLSVTARQPGYVTSVPPVVRPARLLNRSTPDYIKPARPNDKSLRKAKAVVRAPEHITRW